MNSKPTGAWVFEVVNPMGGARATAWRDTLEGSEFSSAERIAREAIQNSVDATLPDLRTEVFVWDKELSDEEISTFKDFLRLDTEHSPSGRLSKLGLKDGNFFERLNEGSSGVRVTIIEDRNTCGLGFDEQVGKDRFEELCLFLGQETPDVDPSRGGSYGFGKTVYQELSDCRTFFVYSEFEPSIETNGHSARLFGCSSFIGHNLEDGVAYTGRAWFGVPESSPTGLQLCKPIVDDDARQLAASLGFMKDGDDPGTSIMIFGSDINIHEFRTAVEDYWWPRILSNRLAVELWENDDYMLHPPEPLDRAELSPYVRCYELIEDGVPLERDERRPRINAIRGKNGGALALKALAAGLDEEKPEDDTPFTNTVALIRSGPRNRAGKP